MAKTDDSIVVCTYRVKAGRETEFVVLLKRHWPTLMRLGLVHEQPRMALKGRDSDTTSCFVEMFAWKEGGFAVAHQHPEVLALWEPMEQMCEARGGHPATEFPHYAVLALSPHAPGRNSQRLNLYSTRSRMLSAGRFCWCCVSAAAQ